MSQVAVPVRHAKLLRLPDPGDAAARLRAAELELMMDLQRELMIPVPGAPAATALFGG